MFLYFFLIQKFHVAFNELCLCIYIKKKTKKKKKFKISKIFPKKEKNFQKKNLWTRDIGLPIDFFKKRPLVCNIMVKFKVCLFIPCFYIFFIQKFHVVFNELCLCIYIKKTKQKKIKKKKFKISKIFPKKEKNFQKKNLWTGDIGLPIDFFKKRPIFFFQRFQDSLKSSFQNGT